MISYDKIRVTSNSTISLRDYATDDTGELKDKKEGKDVQKKNLKELKDLQEKLYAFDRYAVLLVFQAMDAAGKDSTIEHVMSGVNPQGCQVFSFKKPSANELEHDFLWRTYKSMPQRGRIGIFNRSYYEEVLVTRVHPEYILGQRIPGVSTLEDVDEQFWQNRYRSINEMERHLHHNGTVILKFFLNVSKEEQKQRFLKRINRPDKNWKFTMNDVEERKYWDDYQQAFEQAISNTSTEHAPWHIIPADHKWFMRAAVSEIIVDKLQSLDLRFPQVGEEQQENLQQAKEMFENDPTA
ncbi:MAG: polyphosphate kinase 2 family protein [Tunicatimonas sp.]